eukprot:TRINITY_DN2501_c1_g1_i1.p1 TRINITY_DN2501_c1_g1~~TRINITY_DN2501_c1_g1_i1.p1  ORF type:complete len:325 (+),score=54.68 TRINITY_DN2501_c1_g1_i1:34-975(+)
MSDNQVEFGAGAGVVPEQAPAKKGMMGAISAKVEGAKAKAEAVQNSALNYVKDVVQGETGPWPAPGGKWPPEYKNKDFWYPLVGKGKIVHRCAPTRDHKTTKDSLGQEPWATTHKLGPWCSWSRDCPWSCLNCMGAYLYPISVYLVCQQRKQLLLENEKNYECCGGLWGTKFTLLCNESCTEGNEDCCMFLETFLFPWCALRTNRWMIKGHYQLEDNCVDTTLMQVSAPCRVCGECMCSTPELEEIAYIFLTPCYGCLFAQQALEMKARGYPFLGHSPGDIASTYHSTIGCGYSGNVIVQKTINHPHAGATMT